MKRARLGEVRLESFDNSWYFPGRRKLIRVLWLVVSGLFFQTWFPWPSGLKVFLLRSFGARVGREVVIKQRVTIKYPWRLEIGSFTWIGEGAWIDSLEEVRIGSNVCVSQGVMIETGNHDWTDPAFGLVIKPVIVEDGAWLAVRSLVLPGARVRSHVVVGAGAVLYGDTVPYGIYVGNPAKFVKKRTVVEG